MSTEHNESKYAIITHTNDPWGWVKRSFFRSFLKVVMLHIKVKWKKCRPTCKVTLNLHTILTSGAGFKGQILKLCRCKYIFIELSTKTYLTGVCYDTVGELRVR